MVDSVTDAMKMNLGKLQEMVRNREARRAVYSMGSHNVGHDWVTEQQHRKYTLIKFSNLQNNIERITKHFLYVGRFCIL